MIRGDIMNIVHIMNYYQPKMGYQENYLPCYQKANDNNVYIITSERCFPFDNYDERYKKFLGNRIQNEGIINDNGVDIYRFKPDFEDKRHKLIYLNKKNVISVLDKVKPDVIHVHSQKNLNLIYINHWCMKNNCKLFIDCHEDYGNTSLANSRVKRIIIGVFRHFYKSIYINTKCFLAISEESKKFLYEQYDIKSDRIRINGLGANSDIHVSDSIQREVMRKRYGFTDEAIVFICTGRITKEQNFDVVLNSFLEIFSIYPNAKLFLLGSVSEEYGKYIDNNKIYHHEFVNNQDLYKFYSMADVAIWGTATNGTIEAMSCSKPVIIPNQLNCRHLVKMNNGFTFTDKIDCIKKITFFIENSYSIRNMGELSRKYVEESLSWDQIAKQSIEIYNLY